MTEEWRVIPSRPDYLVSNKGRVIGPSGKMLKMGKTHGYIFFTSTVDGKLRGMRAHRAVMEAFVGPSRLHVDHINGIRDDNRLENLRYVTPKQNSEFMIERGASAKGEKVVQSKLTAEQVLAIRRDYKRSSYKKSNVQNLAAKYKVTYFNILLIVNRKTWKHV